MMDVFGIGVRRFEFHLKMYIFSNRLKILKFILLMNIFETGSQLLNSLQNYFQNVYTKKTEVLDSFWNFFFSLSDSI